MARGGYDEGVRVGLVYDSIESTSSSGPTTQETAL